MRVFFLLAFFLLFGAFFIISNNNIALNESGNMGILGTLYYNWLSGIFANFTSISGYIIKADWMPESNSTISR